MAGETCGQECPTSRWRGTNDQRRDRMTQHWRERLGRFGVWRAFSQVTPNLAANLERFGYGAVWLGTSPPGDLGAVDGLLGATSTLVVATGVVNMWQSDPHRSEEHTSELQSRENLVCRLLLE